MSSVFFTECLQAIYEKDYVRFKDNAAELEREEMLYLLEAAVKEANNPVVDYLLAKLTDLTNAEKLAFLRGAVMMQNSDMLVKLLGLGWETDVNISYLVSQYFPLQPLKNYLENHSENKEDPYSIIFYSCMNADVDNVVPYVFDRFYDPGMFDEEGKRENFIQQIAMAGCVEVLAKVDGTEEECQLLQKSKDNWGKYFNALVECIVAAGKDEAGFLSAVNFMEAMPLINQEDREFSEFCIRHLRSFDYSERRISFLEECEDLSDDAGMVVEALKQKHLGLFELKEFDAVNAKIKLVNLIDKNKKYEVLVPQAFIPGLMSPLFFSWVIEFEGNSVLTADPFPVPEDCKDLILLNYRKELRKLEDRNAARVKKKKKAKVKPVSQAEKYKILFHTGINLIRE